MCMWVNVCVWVCVNVCVNVCACVRVSVLVFSSFVWCGRPPYLGLRRVCLREPPPSSHQVENRPPQLRSLDAEEVRERGRDIITWL